MSTSSRLGWRHKKDAGMSLYIVAAAIVFLLGVCGLGIDLVALYLGRSEAQRAADAAALAGATVFVTTSCTSSGSCSGVQTQATNAAIATGNQNLIAGQSPNIQTADVTFTGLDSGNPRITVIARQTIPTFFMKIFGVQNSNVSAPATAEAYNPSGGGGSTLSTSCLKPWILPNCDPAHSTPGNANCPGAGYFIDPTTGAIEHPGSVTSGGVIGEPITLKAGDPQNAPVPSQYYPVELCFSSTTSAICPNCAGSVQTGCNGASIYQQNIECCNTGIVTCGSAEGVDVNLKPGNMQGPTKSGVSCLIHESDQGRDKGTGQDTLCSTSVLPPDTNATCSPLQVYGGNNNPNSALIGQPITSSDSIVTIPLYDGHTLCPGGSCSGNVNITVIGFLQVFLNQVELNGGGSKTIGDVYATIMNISGCGSSGGGGGGGGGGTGGGGGSGGSGGGVSGGGNSAIPVRLVQPG